MNTRLFPISLLSITLALAGLSTPAFAHEFWIEPAQYQVKSGAELTAQFRNGENFDGINLPYFETRSLRFEQYIGGERTALAPRTGNLPAYDFPAPGDGLLVVVHETAPSTVRYKSWDKFAAFAAHKDFPDIRDRHLGRGLPEQDFTESYTRHAKALVAVGSGAGTDLRTGMQTEFVALDNPYGGALSGKLRVQLFEDDAPRADAQVEIFERGPGGAVTVTLARTGADGIAAIPVLSGHAYLLDAVILRPTAKGDTAAWRTLWAALSFAVP